MRLDNCPVPQSNRTPFSSCSGYLGGASDPAAATQAIRLALASADRPPQPRFTPLSSHLATVAAELQASANAVGDISGADAAAEELSALPFARSSCPSSPQTIA